MTTKTQNDWSASVGGGLLGASVVAAISPRVGIVLAIGWMGVYFTSRGFTKMVTQ